MLDHSLHLPRGQVRYRKNEDFQPTHLCPVLPLSGRHLVSGLSRLQGLTVRANLTWFLPPMKGLVTFLAYQGPGMVKPAFENWVDPEDIVIRVQNINAVLNAGEDVGQETFAFPHRSLRLAALGNVEGDAADMVHLALVVAEDLAPALDPDNFPVLFPQAVLPHIGFVGLQGLDKDLGGIIQVFGGA